jgi:hypothetical protein
MGWLYLTSSSDSIEDMQELLKAKTSPLQTVTSRTRSLRNYSPQAARRAATITEDIMDSESVFGDSDAETFAFDQDLHNSCRYQRLATLSTRPLSNYDRDSQMSNLSMVA